MSFGETVEEDAVPGGGAATILDFDGGARVPPPAVGGDAITCDFVGGGLLPSFVGAAATTWDLDGPARD